MEEQRRIIGLDVGSRTIGIAISDPLGITAQGLGVHKRTNRLADVEEISRLAELYQAERIVVGYPVSLSGQVSRQAQEVDDFISRLMVIGLPVEREDERFTTKIAERALIAADLSRAKRKRVIDQQAAILILQGYLDRIRSKERK
ncbi:MAG: Holliday junction resolvase RuvX [Cyanobacteria bacterium NC_groundwater_1444_Ag_S-0.65um_54_12]|nr:Holliday junction resolvase RuvX [Cyanobacteria bacterium NC_groundwater_1444_Ag_S-0.65um_54_12]